MHHLLSLMTITNTQDWYMPINWQTINLLSTFLVALAAFILAFVSYVIVKELKQNRILSIIPRLIMLSPQQEYSFKWLPNDDSPPEIRSTTLNYNIITGLPVMLLKNIGRGPAKNIKIKWSLDSDAIEHIFARNDLLNKYHIKLMDNYAVFFEDSNYVKTKFAIQCRDHDSSELDYCITSHDNEYTDKIFIPESIQGCYLIRLMAMERMNQSYAFVPAPTIKIAIAYQDLEGNRYFHKFLLESIFIFSGEDLVTDINTIMKESFNPDILRGKVRFKIK